MTILNDYFPTDLARGIDLVANISPIIVSNSITDGIYVLKTTGEVVYKDIDAEEYFPIANRITYIEWGHDGSLWMITTEAELIHTNSEEHIILVTIPELEGYDITQISFKQRTVITILTVTGELVSFYEADDGTILNIYRGNNMVQIKNNLALTSKGQVFDLNVRGKKIMTDLKGIFIVKILSSIRLLSLEGIYARFVHGWHIIIKRTDVVQYEMNDEPGWSLYLTKKGNIFVDKPSSIIPSISNVVSFAINYDSIYTVDANDNIKANEYETRAAFFIKDQSLDKFIFVGHELLNSD